MRKYDEIKIEGLSFFANHGVYEFETEQGQTFQVDAVLYEDNRKGCLTDDVENVTDYGAVSHFIHDFLTQNTFHLLETATEETAIAILLNFPLLQGIRLEIKKPYAPLELDFRSVSVSMERFRHTVYLSFGSNVGDRKQHILDGLKELGMHPEIKITQCSELYNTKPYGYTEQDEFLNGVCEIQTLLSPEELLAVMHKVENKEKRTREIHWGPRTLDLDIIYYDDLIISTDELVIPHVDMENRMFVLQPLCEVAKNFRHPILQKTSAQLLDELKKKQKKENEK